VYHFFLLCVVLPTPPWYLAPMGCRLDVSRLDANIPKRVGNGPRRQPRLGLGPEHSFG
jgi:hypothetical protein